VEALLRARDELLAIRPGSVGQSFCQHMEQALHHGVAAENLQRDSIQDSVHDLALELETSGNPGQRPAAPA
jgi:hypothetical protein